MSKSLCVKLRTCGEGKKNSLNSHLMIFKRPPTLGKDKMKKKKKESLRKKERAENRDNTFRTITSKEVNRYWLLVHYSLEKN